MNDDTKVVLEGIRAERGMAAFAGQMTADDTRLIRAFMTDRAIAARDAPPPGQ